MNPLIRIAICLSIAVITGTIAGALLGYVYGWLIGPSVFILSPQYLGVVVLAVCLSCLAGLLALVISICQLRKLWGTLLGFGGGLLFALIVLLEKAAVPATTEVKVIEVAVIATMALIGLLISSISQALLSDAES